MYGVISVSYGGGDSRVVSVSTTKQEGPGSNPDGGKEI